MLAVCWRVLKLAKTWPPTFRAGFYNPFLVRAASSREQSWGCQCKVFAAGKGNSAQRTGSVPVGGCSAANHGSLWPFLVSFDYVLKR